MWQFIVDQIIMFAFVYRYFGWEDRFDLHIFNGGWAVLETLDSLIDLLLDWLIKKKSSWFFNVLRIVCQPCHQLLLFIDTPYNLMSVIAILIIFFK